MAQFGKRIFKKLIDKTSRVVYSLYMKKVTRNEVDFSDIFHFAEEHSGVGRNEANDLFFDRVLKYKGFNDFTIKELKGLTIENSPWCETADTIKCKTIICAFMEKHKIKSMRVFND